MTETILVPKRPLLCEREMLLSKLFLHIKRKIIITSHLHYLLCAFPSNLQAIQS